MSHQATEQARRADIPVWTLADRLRKSLEHAGVDVDEMAQYLEVHPNTIRNWTRGRTRPRASEVTLWAMRTGVSREWLLPRVDSNHQPAGWGMDLGGCVPPPRSGPVTVSGDVQLSGRDILALQRRFTRTITLGGPGRTAGRASADLPTGAAP
jgi:hypothetical protein